MKHRSKRFLSILLSLALVLGMFPGMSLTAYAATSHGITINTAQHGTVTASVNGSAATSAEEGATVTLTANPDNGYRLKSISGVYKDYYNESMSIGNSTTGSSANFSFSAEECNYNGCRLYKGKKITISSSTKTITRVVFTVSGNGNSRNESQLVTSSGTKTVSGTGAGSTITISNLSTNSVSLTGNGSNNAQQWQCNRVVVYGQDISDTTLKVNNTSDPNIRTFTMPAVVQGNVTITAEFEEMPKYKVTLTGGANATTSGGNTTQTELTGAMETVTYTANSGFHFTEFANITNNGITATRTSDTAVTVSGTPTADASITIPDAMKQVQTITASDVTATYGDTDKSVSASVTTPATGGGAISYTVKDGSGDYIDVASDGKLTIKKVPPTDGKAYVIVKAAATDDYAETTKEVTVTISKAEATVAAKDQGIMVGGTVPDLSAPVLNTHYSVTGLVGTDALTTAPTLAYQKNGSAATPDSATAGTYDIVPSGASAGDNYNISYTNGTLTISEKQAVTVTKVPEANALTYNGQAQELVTVGTATGGEIQYALGTATEATQPYTTSIPTGRDAKTYYVWYKAVGDETHTDSEAKCITVTISSESSGGGGGSSSSGGGSSTPSTPTTPTESYTVPVSSENTVNVTANISNGTAVVSEITQSDIDKIVDNGNNSGGGDNTGASENTSITIDVSQAKSEVTSVQLSEKTVEKLTEAVKADNNVESVEIKMTNATIELDGAALSAVSEQAEGSSIKLVVEDTQTTKLNATQQESLKQFASAKPFQAYFESNGKEIHDFKGGKATVSIKFSPETGKDVKYYHMYYLPLAGAIERYETRYIDGMLNFVTGHFSDYAIVYDETRKNETGKEDEDDNTDTDDNNGTDDGKTTEETSETTANGKTAYQNALSINKGLKVSQIGNKITVSWGKVSGANRYEIYVAYCTGKFGKTPVKVVTKKGVTSVTITKLNGKKIELTKNFKVYVAAYKTVDGVKKKLGKTITAHIVGRKNKTYTNVKAIKLAKNKATIKVGKTYKIKASVVLVDPKKKMLSDKHAATFRYASSDKKIATVDKNGKVTAKKKGTCYVWIYAKNGYANKVKVTVK